METIPVVWIRFCRHALLIFVRDVEDEADYHRDM